MTTHRFGVRYGEAPTEIERTNAMTSIILWLLHKLQEKGALTKGVSLNEVKEESFNNGGGIGIGVSIEIHDNP